MADYYRAGNPRKHPTHENGSAPLRPGRHVREDPRFASKYWQGRIDKRDGFSVSFMKRIQKNDEVWKLAVPRRRLVVLVVYKGMVETRCVGESVHWMGADSYYMSFWHPREAHLVRVGAGEVRMAVLELSQAFIRRFVGPDVPVRYEGGLVNLTDTKRPVHIHGLLNPLMHVLYYHLENPGFQSPMLKHPDRMYLSRFIRQAQLANERLEDPRMQELVQFIGENLSSSLTLEVLCRRMAMSERYIRRKFKQMMGISLRRYIIGVKMDRAMDLIEDSSMPIGYIALEVGYENLISFEKAFKKRFAHPPSHFRTRRKME